MAKDKRVGARSRYKRKTTGKLPPKRKSTKGQKITAKQAEAVKHYFELNNSVTAVARRMNIPYGTMKDWFRTDCVKAEIQKRIEELQEKTGYGLEVSMAEAAEGMELARTSKNANAFVKAVELRAKLNQLLVEKHEFTGMAPFSLQIVGLGQTPPKQIEVTPVEQLPSGNEETLSADESKLLEI